MTYRPPSPDHDDFDDEDRDRPPMSRIRPVLVIVGGLLIFEQISGNNIDILQLGAGVFFLCWWARARNLWQLLVGLFLVLGPMADVLGGFGIGNGHHSMLPLLVMSAGALMVFRRNLPPGVLGALWMVIVVSLVISITSSWDNDGGPNRPVFVKRRAIEDSIPTTQFGGPLPDLTGKTVVINTRDGDVDLFLGGDMRPLDGNVKVLTTPGVVVLDVSDDTEIDLPAEVTVTVTSAGNGDIEVVAVGDPHVEATTESGEIDLDGYGDVDEPDRHFTHDGTTPGTLTIVTRSGDIDLERTPAKLR